MFCIILMVCQQLISEAINNQGIEINVNRMAYNAMLPICEKLTYQVNDCNVEVLFNGQNIETIFTGSQFKAFSYRDTVKTIWLPDTMGGVINPDIFICNPIHDLIYIIGKEQQNIAVCDRQTGERISGIRTSNTTKSMAYSETSDKVYCASNEFQTIEVFDGSTNSLIKTISLMDYPQGMVWNSINNEIYCAFSSFPFLSVIDCALDSIILDIPVGGPAHPWRIVYNSISNKIYCPTIPAPYNDSVYIVDGYTHAIISSLPIGGDAQFSTINTTHNKVYLASRRDDIITVIDGDSDSLLAEIPVNVEPYCIEYNSVMDRIYIGHRIGTQITVLDGATDSIIDILPLGVEVLSMAYDSIDNRLFCSIAWEDLIVFDCSTYTIIDTLNTDDFTVGQYWDSSYNQLWVGNSWYQNWPTFTIYGFAADSLTLQFNTTTGFTPYKACLHEPTRKLFSVGIKDRYISILNLDSPANGMTKEVGSFPFDIIQNPYTDKIYCANRYADSIIVLDAFTDSILAQIPSDPEPVRFAFNETNNKIYCANLSGNSVTVIDGVTNDILDTIPVGNRPISILWNSIDNKIYVGNSTDCTITIIDGSVDTVITTVPSGKHQWALCHDIVTDKIYSADFLGDTVTIIDGATNQVLKYCVIINPHCLAHNPDGNKMYCGSWGCGMIYVFDCETDSIINTIYVGDGISSLLYNPVSSTLFCVYISLGNYPFTDALAVIDCTTDEIIARYISDAQRWSNGLSDPKDALILDSLNNLIYFTHYTASKISVLDGATGLLSYKTIQAENTQFIIYPNPFNEKLVMHVPRLLHQTSLKIFDVEGRLVKEFTSLKKCDLQWDGTDQDNRQLPSGIYFIRLCSQYGVQSKKVLLIK